MLILDNRVHVKAWREIKRVARALSVRAFLQWAALIGSLGGISFASLVTARHQNAAIGSSLIVLYLVLGLCVLLVSHYARSYFLEKEKNAQSIKFTRNLHDIAHMLRDMMVNSEPNDEESDIEWARRYIPQFQKAAQDICKALKQAMTQFGYKVDHVCIKSYDGQAEEVHTVGRSNERQCDSDAGEHISHNPFVLLIHELFHDYDTYISDKELQQTRQNRRTTEFPRYLAIDGVSTTDFPSRLVTMYNNHYLCADHAKKVGTSEQLRDRVKERARNHYQSCMGILITRIFPNPKVRPLPCAGCIGIDSTRRGVWDFLAPEHVQILGAVADLLCYPMEMYNLCTVVLKEDLQQEVDQVPCQNQGVPV